MSAIAYIFLSVELNAAQENPKDEKCSTMQISSGKTAGGTTGTPCAFQFIVLEFLLNLELKSYCLHIRLFAVVKYMLKIAVWMISS